MMRCHVDYAIYSEDDNSNDDERYEEFQKTCWIDVVITLPTKVALCNFMSLNRNEQLKRTLTTLADALLYNIMFPEQK